MKISSKLLIFIIGLGIASAIITAGVLYKLNQSIFESDVRQGYINIVSRSSNEISQYIREYRKIIESTADILGTLKIDKWTSEILVRIISRDFESFRDICIVDPDGKEIVSAVPRMFPRSFEGEKVIRKALSGEPAYSRVYFDNSNMPAMSISVPIRQREVIIGAVWVDFELRAIWEILEEMVPGDKGAAFLYDSEGKPLPRSAAIPSRLVPAPARLELSRYDLYNDPATWAEKGEFASYLITAMRIAETNWILVLYRSLHDINSLFYENLWLSTGVTLIVSIITCVVAFFFVRKFVHPIKDLVDGARRLSSGELSHRVKIKSKDEIGDLCISFNHMADELHKYMQNTVQQIEKNFHKKNLVMLGVTASTVSHQVKNSLNVMSFALDNIRMGGVNPTIRRSVDAMERNIEDLRVFTEKHLSFARKPSLVFREVNLKEVFEKLVKFHSLRDLSITILYIPSQKRFFTLECDWQHLSQAFSCILENGREIQNGHAAMIIEIIDQEETVQFNFHDKGPGINMEDPNIVFKPFYTTKGDGTGLGLALANNIIEAHSGIIELKNSEYGGACFSVELPKKNHTYQHVRKKEMS